MNSIKEKRDSDDPQRLGRFRCAGGMCQTVPELIYTVKG